MNIVSDGYCCSSVFLVLFVGGNYIVVENLGIDAIGEGMLIYEDDVRVQAIVDIG